MELEHIAAQLSHNRTADPVLSLLLDTVPLSPGMKEYIRGRQPGQSWVRQFRRLLGTVLQVQLQPETGAGGAGKEHG